MTTQTLTDRDSSRHAKRFNGAPLKAEPLANLALYTMQTITLMMYLENDFSPTASFWKFTTESGNLLECRVEDGQFVVEYKNPMSRGKVKYFTSLGAEHVNRWVHLVLRCNWNALTFTLYLNDIQQSIFSHEKTGYDSSAIAFSHATWGERFFGSMAWFHVYNVPMDADNLECDALYDTEEVPVDSVVTMEAPAPEPASV